MLPSFEIVGFRTFAHLRIERLGRVNLIVGRNNVGKTNLLEALRLYSTPGRVEAIQTLLLDHDEVVLGEKSQPERNILPLAVEGLFFDRAPRSGELGEIRLGPMGDESIALRIQVRYVKRVRNGLEAGKEETVEIAENDLALHPDAFPSLLLLQGRTRATWTIEHLSKQLHAAGMPQGPPWVGFGKSGEEVAAKQWDAVALRDGEARVVQALQLIEPRIERITLVNRPWGEGRLVMARFRDRADPVPFKSLGDGMFRMYQIALAIEYARNIPEPRFLGWSRIKDEGNGRPEAMVLIDEIENGIHYTVLPDLWRFIFKVAKLHNLQVFATTHSWDCIEAFQKAAAEDEESEGVLIRLERKNDRIRAVVFDERELAIVTKGTIEVR
jgi:hypothetical protein